MKCKNCGGYCSTEVKAPNGDMAPLCEECFAYLICEKGLRGFTLVRNSARAVDEWAEDYAEAKSILEEMEEWKKMARKQIDRYRVAIIDGDSRYYTNYSRKTDALADYKRKYAEYRAVSFESKKAGEWELVPRLELLGFI